MKAGVIGAGAVPVAAFSGWGLAERAGTHEKHRVTEGNRHYGL